MTIRIEGLSELLAKITRLSQLAGVKAALRVAALHIKGKVARYPAASHRPQPFVSDKQRRGFFYHLKHGDIEVPYRRGTSPGSETLGRRWTTEARNSGLTQVIGNNASYAQLVQGPERQTAYHAATGWQTTAQVAEQEAPVVIEYVRAAIENELSQ